MNKTYQTVCNLICLIFIISFAFLKTQTSVPKSILWKHSQEMQIAPLGWRGAKY